MDAALDFAPSMDEKRKLFLQDDSLLKVKPAKKQRKSTLSTEDADETNSPALVPPSKEGISVFNDNDVLSGRGGSTNIHPGNMNFRKLINENRTAYLKARKRDKPAISREIVRRVRETGARFLKQDAKSGLYYEIGDVAAREKASQALRQNAPEMRMLLLNTENQEVRVATEEQIPQGHLPQAGIVMAGVSQNAMGQTVEVGQNIVNSSNGMNGHTQWYDGSYLLRADC